MLMCVRVSVFILILGGKEHIFVFPVGVWVCCLRLWLSLSLYLGVPVFVHVSVSVSVLGGVEHIFVFPLWCFGVGERGEGAYLFLHLELGNDDVMS